MFFLFPFLPPFRWRQYTSLYTGIQELHTVQTTCACRGEMFLAWGFYLLSFFLLFYSGYKSCYLLQCTWWFYSSILPFLQILSNSSLLKASRSSANSCKEEMRAIIFLKEAWTLLIHLRRKWEQSYVVVEYAKNCFNTVNYGQFCRGVKCLGATSTLFL